MRRHILVITMLLAFCNIGYELLIAATLSVMSGDSLLAYSLTVGFYLAALGLGTLLSTKVKWSAEGMLVRIEIALAVFGVAFPIVLCFFDWIFGSVLFELMNARVALVVLGQIGVITIGVLAGFEIPLLIEIDSKGGSTERATSRVLAFTYFGTLVGSLVFALILWGMWNSIQIGALFGLINGTVAAFIVLRSGVRQRLNAAFSGVLVVLLPFAFFAGPSIEQVYLKQIYYNRYVPGLAVPEISSAFTEKPHVQRVRLGEDVADLVLDEGEDPGFSFYVNRQMKFHSKTERLWHETLAHVPVQISGHVPERILVLGGGNGLLARELAKYGKELTLVEPNAKLVQLARTHPLLIGINENALDRVRVVTADPMKFLRSLSDTQDTYDAIYFDLPTGVTRLSSREFMLLMLRRISKGGYWVSNLKWMDRPLVRDSIAQAGWVRGITFKHREFAPTFLYVSNAASAPTRLSKEFSNLQLEPQTFTSSPSTPFNSVFRPVH